MVQPTGTEGVQIIKMSNEKAKGGERIKIGPQAGDQTYDAFMTRVLVTCENTLPRSCLSLTTGIVISTYTLLQQIHPVK